jgi:hypothetical protein
MRKLVFALAAFAALGLAVPVVSTPADAQTVVVKKKYGDRGWHRGHRNVTVIKSVPRRAYTHRAQATKVVIKKKRPANRVIIRSN